WPSGGKSVRATGWIGRAWWKSPRSLLPSWQGEIGKSRTGGGLTQRYRRGCAVGTDPASRKLRHDAVAALVLRLEQLLVGRADDLVGRQGLAAAGRRQADADRHDVALAFVLEQVLLDLAADALGDVDAALEVRLRQHHRELLAAVAGEQLLLA